MEISNSRKLEYILRNSVFLDDETNDLCAELYARVHDDMELSLKQQQTLDGIFNSIQKDGSDAISY